MLTFNYLIAATALTLVHLVIPSAQAAIEVTNEQLRDGLLSLIHSYSLLENKLDRHEQRERALGDVLKRGISTLTKGQKIFEPMRGTLSRLDERINQIETQLMVQDEKFNEQKLKMNKALESFENWIATNKPSKENVEATGKLTELSNQVEDMAVNVKAIREEVTHLITKHAATNETTTDLLLKTQNLIKSKLNATDNVVSRFDEKLSQFYAGAPPTEASRGTQWEENVIKSLDEIKTNIILVKSCDGGSDSGDKDFFIGINNQTLEAIEDMRHEVLLASDKSFIKTSSKIKEITDNLDASINELLKSVGESGTSESFCEGITSSVVDVKKELVNLHKLEQMLATMGDNVLSVKRSMEFNVHAITLEVGNVVKINSNELNETINNKFDAINETILSNHNGALANLTSKIETEISQVWRQVGIMYKEVSSSKDTLNKLQDLTEAYVNGTFSTMDSMGGKVTQITGRIADVDSNLNYLLGRLSLVTQEFKKVKTELGSALTAIRSNLQIGNKIEVVGPGPHKIESEEEQEPDFNLLPQRDAPAEKNRRKFRPSLRIKLLEMILTALLFRVANRFHWYFAAAR